MLVEEWDRDEALEEHFKTAHIADFMKAIGAAPPEVEFHTIASSIDLAGVSAG